MTVPSGTAVAWRRSTRCGEAGHCVEVGRIGDDVAIRDSTAPQSHLIFSAPVWRDFIAGVRTGEFDRG